jgi:hypothetical protein
MGWKDGGGGEFMRALYDQRCAETRCPGANAVTEENGPRRRGGGTARREQGQPEGWVVGWGRWGSGGATVQDVIRQRCVSPNGCHPPIGVSVYPTRRVSTRVPINRVSMFRESCKQRTGSSESRAQVQKRAKYTACAEPSANSAQIRMKSRVKNPM